MEMYSEPCEISKDRVILRKWLIKGFQALAAFAKCSILDVCWGYVNVHCNLLYTLKVWNCLNFLRKRRLIFLLN